MRLECHVAACIPRHPRIPTDIIALSIKHDDEMNSFFFVRDARALRAGLSICAPHGSYR